MNEHRKILLLLFALVIFKPVWGGGCSGLVLCTVDPCTTTTCAQYPQATCRTIVDECGRCTAVFNVSGRDFTADQCNRQPSCPDGSAPVTCAANPCDTSTCPGVPNAECRVNRCGSCRAEFYTGDTKISNQRCAQTGCPQRSCRPCQNAVCPDDTAARCEEERCGKCKATFYGTNNIKIERCCRTETCADGSTRFRCSKNPCAGGSACFAIPHARCVPDYCGGCKKKFVMPDGTEVSESICTPMAFCPPGAFTAKCAGDMCQKNPCKRYPGATCQIDGCNGCKTIYYYEGKRLTEEQCNGCPNNDRVSACGNPCNGASCGGARCEPQVCGQCRARFFGNDRGEINTCGTTQGCSGGLRRIQCSADPCTINDCPGVTNAECRSNYCGGCHAEYYYPGTNRRIPDYICAEKEICPGDLPVAGCASTSACMGETCPNYPEAKCHLDSCNGCSVTFYEGRRRLTREDCHGCPAGVERKQCVNPCKDAVCALYPTARCEPRVCGKCGVAFFGLDRREIADCCAEAPTVTTTTTTTTTAPTTVTLTTTTPTSPITTPPQTPPQQCPGTFFPPRSCRPCQEGATCPEVSSARCEDRRCRMCKAAFFGQDGAEIQSCCQDGEKCADGTLKFHCRKNPCDGATCPGNRFATCRPNYCGGCKAEFFSTITNRKLSDTDCILLDPCPPGTPLPGCRGPNMCLGRTCPNFPNAECKLDACGSCHVVFYDGRKRLTDEDCNGCGSSLRVENCEDPCKEATCPNDPDARCEARRCGQCSAVFFGRDRKQVSNCGGTFCPNGKRRFNCFEDPCNVKTCPGYPGATCTADFCGGCNAIFRDIAGNILSEFACMLKERCPGDLPVAGCRGPGRCLGRSCPNYPSAECWIDGCGGCNVVFYDGTKRLTAEDCNGCPAGQTKAANCDDPCDNALCPLCPTARCEARRCGTCRAVFFGEDRKEIKSCCGNIAGNQCPPDQPLHACKKNPCQGATCPAELLAECRPNYCGGCKAEFYISDRKLSYQQCGLCANGKQPINCGIVPLCFEKTCQAFPNAKCKSTNCGECRQWFEDDNGNVVDCDATGCPRDSPRQNCPTNPCDGATCPAVTQSVCRPNYCGGCKAEFFSGIRKLTDYDCIEKPDRCAAFTTCLRNDSPCGCGDRQNVRCVTQFCPPNSCKIAFFDQNGARIPDDQCVVSPPPVCPPDNPPASCRIDPCQTATCPGETRAVCRLNFCGGCFAEFYLKGKKLSDLQCVKRLDECAAFTTCPTNVCRCPAIPNAQCVIQFCSPNQCKPLFFDANGKKVSYADCGLCEDGTEHINCGIVPQCSVSTCPAHPNARCRASNCGVCREWWEDANGNIVDCEVKVQCDAPQSIANGRVTPTGRKIELGEYVWYTCNTGYRRRGNRQRRCVDRRGRGRLSGSRPQCYDRRCPSSLDSFGICVTQCSSNAECGFNRLCCWNGCAAVCHARRDRCPGGEPYVQCFSNPCDFASCPSYSDAKCVPNYCGGCFYDWYRGNTKLPEGSCDGPDPRCPSPELLPRVCVADCTTSADCRPFQSCCLNSCGYKYCV